MGRLERMDGTAGWPLHERTIVGRSQACNLRISEPRSSEEHARIVWSGSAWELQDLQSCHGTFAAGRRLGDGERVPLLAGMRLGFGRSEDLVVASVAPPEALAVPLGGGPVIAGPGGLLVLPGPERPLVTVRRGPGPGWSLERGGDVRPVISGVVVDTAEGAWQLVLPESLAPADDAAEARVSVERLALRFHVRDDDEDIELHALHGRQRIDLHVRVHHRPLLLLAQARLRDRELPAKHQGWVDQAWLCGQLGCDQERLYVDVYRVRRQLAAAGVADAARLVERRSRAGLLRIGVADLEISAPR